MSAPRRGLQPDFEAQNLPHRSFSLFPKLPIELRLAIWRLSLEPRVVELRYSGAVFEQGCEYSESYNIPTALITCKESRSAVIASYPLCFGSTFHPEATRFNFEIDTLYLNYSLKNHIDHFFDLLKDRELKGIKFLAIDWLLCETHRWSQDRYRYLLGNMRQAVEHLIGLEELLSVHDLPWMSKNVCIDGVTQSLHSIPRGTVTLYDDVSDIVRKSQINIKELPGPEEQEFYGYNRWQAPKRKPVYG